MEKDNIDTSSELMELKQDLKKNHELDEEILKDVKYIKKYIYWQKVYSWIKIILIVASVISGVLYLPTLISQLTSGMGL